MPQGHWRRPRFTSIAFLILLGAGALPAQVINAPSVAETFPMNVYAWFPDGAIRRLSPGPGFFVQPCVHPKGKEAVFWGGSEGRPRLWLFDFASNRVRPITSTDVGSVEPSFDWAGRRIVFASEAPGTTHLELLPIAQSWKDRTFGGYNAHLNVFLIDADGKNRRQVTRGAFRDSRPAFDPDGKHVVFLSNRGGEPDGLYLVPLDGSSPPRRLLTQGGIGRPWFSADGKFVYFFFTGVPDEHRRICRLPLDGQPWEPVTPDGLPRSHGSFADPDGVHVWFHSTKDGNTSPYRFNPQTSELVRFVPPGFTSAGHVTRSRNGIVTFDSRQLVNPTRDSSPLNNQMQRTKNAAQAMDARR